MNESSASDPSTSSPPPSGPATGSANGHRSKCKFLATCLVLSSITAAHAASISWDTPQNIIGAADVSTQGTLFGTWAPGNETASSYPVNGVTFQSANTLGATATGLAAPSAAGTHTTPDANYNVLLNIAARGTGTTATVTINADGTKPLVVGRQYLVQLWISDTQSAAASRTESVSGSATVAYHTSSGMGQYLTGRFVADATTQQLTFAANSLAQFNLMQVRDITVTGALVWNNGAGTGRWNTTDANWSGNLWVNSTSGAATFTATGGTISLASVTAGAITYGNSTANIPSGAFAGGSLVADSLTVQGNGTNGGTYANNPTLTLNIPSANIAGDLAVGRANLAITGGNITANRLIPAAASVDWGRLVLSGGTLTTVNGIDGSLNGSLTFAIDLNGGILVTPSLRVADREAGTNNSAVLTFNGGTLRASASSTTFITLYGGNQNAYIGDGGAVIDTNGNDIVIGVNLLASGGGGLTKTGAGTLTLSGTNTYLGPTTVSSGTLSIRQASLSPGSTVTVAHGATLDLGFSGSNLVAGLVVDGVALSAGTYDATTLPAFLTGSGQLTVPPPSPLANAPNDGLNNLRRMKYGLFVHYVSGGANYPLTVNRDGSAPAGLNDVANRFDAAGFANDVAAMGVEYIVFTAWHANMNSLGPNTKMDQWVPGHTATRDVLGEMVDAVRAKGVRVLFYTHPRDGHDMNQADQTATGWGGPGSGANPDWNLFNRLKWNNFINDVYGKLVDRYGDRIDGIYIDEGSSAGDSWRVVDYPRLRQTIKRHNPDLIMLQNYYGTTYSCDIGDKEYSHWGEFASTDGRTWPVWTMPVATCFSSVWWASHASGVNTVTFSASDMFRYTVLQAAGNTDGGGVQWAAGPYPGGGWETGVLATMEQVAAYLAPIRRSVCNTLPSMSWITTAGVTINTLTGGFVATRSPDDGTEFVHVLTPPTGTSITLPAPADGRGYVSASLLANNHPATLIRNGDGSLTLSLPAGDGWDPRDTVFALVPAGVSWNGTDASKGPGTGSWNQTADNFSGGTPVSTRFRSGDAVRFGTGGATDVCLTESATTAGDLAFAAADRSIRANTTGATLVLTSGRIDVANGITATLNGGSGSASLSLGGNAGLTKTGGGTLVLDLPSAVAGTTKLVGGILAVRAGALGTIDEIAFNGGTLRLLSGNTEDLSSRIRHSTDAIRVDTGGNDVIWSTPLSATNAGGLVKLGSGTLTLAGGELAAGSGCAIDGGTLRLDRGGVNPAAIANAGFESPAYPSKGWAYNPVADNWTFIASSGIASNGSAWFLTAPEGVQAAFLQNSGSLTGTVTPATDGQYVISFSAANRVNYAASGLTVSLDGVVLATWLPGFLGRGGDFNSFQLPALHLTAGPHVLLFQSSQNGTDSATIVDNVLALPVASGVLPAGTRLSLTGTGASFDPGPGTVTLDSLAAVPDSNVILTNTTLVITGNDANATFAGNLVGTGNLTNYGTLRLTGNATLGLTGTFTNTGMLDILTWNGTLPPGFVNHGIVLDRSKIRLNSFGCSGADFILSITGYAGHGYQLQRTSDFAGPWTNVGSAQTGSGVTLNFTDPGGAGLGRQFYRIAVSP